MAKCKEHMFKGKEEQVEPLDWRDVKNGCSNTNSAGGLDVWTKKERHMISEDGFKWITKWMQLIEDTNE